MTLTCDLDLELAWLSYGFCTLRGTFDQSLMEIFQSVQETWSGQESVTEGQTDGQMDRGTDGRTDGQTKAISVIPHPLRGGELIIFMWLFEPF